MASTSAYGTILLLVCASVLCAHGAHHRRLHPVDSSGVAGPRTPTKTVAPLESVEDDECTRTMKMGGGLSHVWSSNGNCYVYYGERASFPDASSTCTSFSGHLVTFNSKDEASLVESSFHKYLKANMTTTTGGSAYIGYTDAKKEGQWRWVTGEIAISGGGGIFTNWRQSEPNNARNEDCAEMTSSSGHPWNDVACREKRAFICEFEGLRAPVVQIKGAPQSDDHDDVNSAESTSRRRRRRRSRAWEHYVTVSSQRWIDSAMKRAVNELRNYNKQINVIPERTADVNGRILKLKKAYHRQVALIKLFKQSLPRDVKKAKGWYEKNQKMLVNFSRRLKDLESNYDNVVNAAQMLFTISTGAKKVHEAIDSSNKQDDTIVTDLEKKVHRMYVRNLKKMTEGDLRRKNNLKSVREVKIRVRSLIHELSQVQSEVEAMVKKQGRVTAHSIEHMESVVHKLTAKLARMILLNKKNAMHELKWLSLQSKEKENHGMKCKCGGIESASNFGFKCECTGKMKVCAQCNDALPSCADILASGKSKGNGIYSINPTGDEDGVVETYCDMTTDGGGWTLLQRTVWDWAETGRLMTDYNGWYSQTTGSPSPQRAFRVAGKLWPELSNEGSHLMSYAVRRTDSTSCMPLYYRAEGGLWTVNPDEYSGIEGELTDVSSSPVANCPLKCANNGTLDQAACKCNCMPPWDGLTCTDCPVKCAHNSVLDAKDCKCRCEFPWTGVDCSECPLSCENGGTKDEKNCKCVCTPSWTGVQCAEKVGDTGTPGLGGLIKAENDKKLTTDATACRALGAGISIGLAGEPIRFYVFAYDGMGDRRLKGGDVFKGYLSMMSDDPHYVPRAAPTLQKADLEAEEEGDPGEPGMPAFTGIEVPVTVIDNSDGSYQMSYTANLPGTYQLHVQLRERTDDEEVKHVDIDGSPFIVRVKPYEAPKPKVSSEEEARVNSPSDKEDDDAEGGDDDKKKDDKKESKGATKGKKDDAKGSSKDDPAKSPPDDTNGDDENGEDESDATELDEDVTSCLKRDTECLNDGHVDEKSCTCVCEDPWHGENCEKCLLKPSHCHHGSELDADSCMCKGCNAPWGGDLCDQCLRQESDCLNEGVLDHRTCKCTCQGKWTGAVCGECPLESKMCENGSLLDKNECLCVNCPDNFVGPLCNQCRLKERECLHGSRFNPNTCSCEDCPSPWQGKFCSECSRSDDDCINGGIIDQSTCWCSKCFDGWGGEFCDVCNLKVDHCLHGGQLKWRTCECSCPFPWSGDLCQTCTLSQSECLHGGTLDTKGCRCKCAEPWEGEMCQVCSRTAAFCSGRGSINSRTCECECDGAWSGPQCTKCSRSPLECQNGSKLNPRTCRCDINCAKPWSGPTCGKCKLKQLDCKNKGILNKEKCVCEKCREPWQGTTCENCPLREVDCLGNGGQLNLKLCSCGMCKRPWQGARCDVCSLTQEKCQNGGILRKDLCRCICPAESKWAGVLCDSCSLSHNSCPNGVLDKKRCVCVDKESGDIQSASWRDESCPNKCYHRGKCVNGKCRCNVLFDGESCEHRKKLAQCRMTGGLHVNTLNGRESTPEKDGVYILHDNDKADSRYRFTVQVAVHNQINVGVVVHHRGDIVSVGGSKPQHTTVTKPNGDVVPRVQIGCKDKDPFLTHRTRSGLQIMYQGNGWLITGPGAFRVKITSTPQLGMSVYARFLLYRSGDALGLCGAFGKTKAKTRLHPSASMISTSKNLFSCNSASDNELKDLHASISRMSTEMMSSADEEKRPGTCSPEDEAAAKKCCADVPLACRHHCEHDVCRYPHECSKWHSYAEEECREMDDDADNKLVFKNLEQNEYNQERMLGRVSGEHSPIHHAHEDSDTVKHANLEKMDASLSQLLNDVNGELDDTTVARPTNVIRASGVSLHGNSKRLLEMTSRLAPSDAEVSDVFKYVPGAPPVPHLELLQVEEDGHSSEQKHVEECPSGKRGIVFDGTHTHCIISSKDKSPLFMQEFSVEMWIKPQEFHSQDTVGLFGNYLNSGDTVVGYSLALSNKPEVVFQVGTGSQDAKMDTGLVGPVSWTTWTHVAATYDGEMAKVYINGMLKAQSKTNGAQVRYSPATDFKIGVEDDMRDGGITQKFFKGIISEIRVWSVVRGSSEISDNMKKSLKSDTPGLAAYYRFNDGGNTLESAVNSPELNAKVYPEGSATWTEEGFPCASCDIKTCANGGTLDEAACECKCFGSWAGTDCSECTVNACSNGGTMDDAACRCNCPSNWKGAQCTECSLQCHNGGTLNKESCSCACVPPHEGPECDGEKFDAIPEAGNSSNNGTAAGGACPVVMTCSNGGTFDQTTCKCSCASPWEGEKCEQCKLTCANNGVLNDKGGSCQCECPIGYTGERCDRAAETRCEGDHIFSVEPSLQRVSWGAVDGVLKEVPVSSTAGCARVCAEEDACRSFTFYESKSEKTSPNSVASTAASAPAASAPASVTQQPTTTATPPAAGNETAATAIPPPSTESSKTRLASYSSEKTGEELDSVDGDKNLQPGAAAEDKKCPDVTCSHDGIIDPETCKCHCQHPWSGDECDDCMTSEEDTLTLIGKKPKLIDRDTQVVRPASQLPCVNSAMTVSMCIYPNKDLGGHGRYGLFRRGSTKHDYTPTMWLVPSDTEDSEDDGYILSAAVTDGKGSPDVIKESKGRVKMNRWSSVAMVVTPTEMKIYINGKTDKVELFENNLRWTGGSAYVGSDPWNGGFEGYIALAQIHPKAVAVEELYRMSEACQGREEPSGSNSVKGEAHEDGTVDEIDVSQGTEVAFTRADAWSAALEVSHSFMDSQSFHEAAMSGKMVRFMYRSVDGSWDRLQFSNFKDQTPFTPAKGPSGKGGAFGSKATGHTRTKFFWSDSNGDGYSAIQAGILESVPDLPHLTVSGKLSVADCAFSRPKGEASTIHWALVHFSAGSKVVLDDGSFIVEHGASGKAKIAPGGKTTVYGEVLHFTSGFVGLFVRNTYNTDVNNHGFVEIRDDGIKFTLEEPPANHKLEPLDANPPAPSAKLELLQLGDATGDGVCILSNEVPPPSKPCTNCVSGVKGPSGCTPPIPKERMFWGGELVTPNRGGTPEARETCVNHHKGVPWTYRNAPECCLSCPSQFDPENLFVDSPHPMAKAVVLEQKDSNGLTVSDVCEHSGLRTKNDWGYGVSVMEYYGRSAPKPIKKDDAEAELTERPPDELVCDVKHIRVYGTGIIRCEVGRPCRFMVLTYDKYERRMVEGCADLKCDAIKQTQIESLEVAQETVTDGEKGKCSSKPPVVESKADILRSLDMPQNVAGNETCSGSSAAQISVVHADCADNMDGSYSCQYEVPETADWTLCCRLGGQSLTNFTESEVKCWNPNVHASCHLSGSDCQHGSVLDKDLCHCKHCPLPWTGQRCQNCPFNPADCHHGSTLDQSVCRCVNCPTPWMGDFCAKCSITEDSCLNGAVLDPKACKCVGCKAPWTGEYCDTCDLIPEDCEHGGKLDHEKCRCKDCPEPWTGARCEKCTIEEDECNHGSMLDKHVCKCLRCRYPWSGELCDVCSRKDSDCKNGGKVNKDTCICEDCDDPWEGDQCDKCSLKDVDCQNGGVLNPIKCRCDRCSAPWTGPLCLECSLNKGDCKNGSILDKKLCQCSNCKPPGVWGGRTCEDCMRTQDMCQNGSTLNKGTCKCDIDCPPRFAGDPICGKCTLTRASCKHSSSLNSKTCECEECPARWKGPFCDKCGRRQSDCQNGGKLDSKACMCTGCRMPWQGELCDECGRSENDCLHNGQLDFERCRCVNCDKPWGGILCEKCVLKDSECQHGGKVNKKTCRCDCPKNKPWWTGDLCHICTRTQKDCQNGGVLNKEICKCKCPRPWKGDLCEICGRSQGQCQHNGKLDKTVCHCVKCDNPWEGIFCEKCGRRNDECKHGARLNQRTCECDINCPPPWGGPLCGTCGRKDDVCLHGGKINKVTCTCIGCNGRWEGELCEVCGLKQSDCQHGGRVNKGKCICEACQTPWEGDLCHKCKHPPCMNGGVIDNARCRCMCKGNWQGKTCNQCTRKASECKNGAKMNMQTCRCTGCPKPYWGENCDRCPKGKNGKECSGLGQCINGCCQCRPSRGGKTCDIPTHTRKCTSGGDPHPVTFDGAAYDWYYGGEFIQYRNKKSCKTEEVHFVTKRAGRVAWNRGLSVQYGDVKMAYYSGFGNNLMVNCQNRGPGSHNVKGVQARWNGRGYDFTLPSGTRASIRGTYITIFARGPTDGSVDGLCGNMNGNRNDDFLPGSKGYRRGNYRCPSGWGLKFRVPRNRSHFCHKAGGLPTMSMEEIAEIDAIDAYMHKMATDSNGESVCPNHAATPAARKVCASLLNTPKYHDCFTDACLDPKNGQRWADSATRTIENDKDDKVTSATAEKNAKAIDKSNDETLAKAQ